MILFVFPAVLWIGLLITLVVTVPQLWGYHYEREEYCESLIMFAIFTVVLLVLIGITWAVFPPLFPKIP